MILYIGELAETSKGLRVPQASRRHYALCLVDLEDLQVLYHRDERELVEIVVNQTYSQSVNVIWRERTSSELAADQTNRRKYWIWVSSLMRSPGDLNKSAANITFPLVVLSRMRKPSIVIDAYPVSDYDLSLREYISRSL